ncbi:MAG: polymer-forming cytoskeletal protein [Oscillochloris sp.]|nr:polymer-forming cytoskeletal protein [Oscillochloris sp.]
MRALRLLIGLLFGLFPVAVFAQASEPAPALVVPAGTNLDHDLATFNRSIVVLGTVEGDVTSWSGDIRIEGRVGGDVVTYAGTVELGPAAMITGSVFALGGGAEGSDGAQIAGALIGNQPLAGGLLSSSADALFGPPAGAETAPRLLFSLALGLFTLLFTTACALIWPRRTTGVGRALMHAPGRAIALGLLSSLLLALLALPLGALLAISLIGMPLLLLGVVALQLPYLFGMAGLSRALTARLNLTAAWPVPAAVALGALLLLTPLVLIGAFGSLTAAMLLFYLIAGAGFGAALISRGGIYAIG